MYKLRIQNRDTRVVSGSKLAGMQYVTYANYKHAKKMFASEQRRTIDEVERKFAFDLNTYVDCDNNLFWGLIQKRKGKPRSTCSQILTESGLTWDPSLITEGFSSFYTELYAPLQADLLFERQLCTCMRPI